MAVSKLKSGVVTHLAAPEQFLALVELSPDAILIHTEGCISYANAAAVRLLHADSASQIVGVEALALVHPDDREMVRERIARQNRGENVPRIEQRYMRADGSVVDVEVTSAPFVYGGRTAIQVFVRDISERKAADRRIGRLTDLYAALSLTSQAITRLRDRDALLNECCRIAVRHGGLRMTWVVRAAPETKRAIRVATSAPAAAYEEIIISLDPDQAEGRGPIAMAIRDDRSYLCDDVMADPNMAPWHEPARRHGLRSAAAFPLHRGGKVWGAIIHYAGETGFFRQDLVDLLERMAEDISFALDNIESDTRHALVEKALLQQERRIETLMGNLPGMAYRCRNDSHWTMELISEGCFELTGYRVEELLFNEVVSFESIIHPEDQRRVRDEIDAGLLERRRFVIEYRIIGKDGEEKWVWERGQGVNDENGNLIALEGFVTEVTERRRAEHSLRESEARFRSLVELSSDWYWEQDENSRFTEVSRGFYQHVRPEEFIGRARWEIKGALPPAEGWDAHRQMLARHEPFRDLEYGRVLAGGIIRHFSFSGEPMFDEERRFKGYRGVGRDVTARRNAEEDLIRFRAAMETSADAIFITDFSTMRYLDVNDTACRMLGYSRDELLRMGVQDLNSDEDLPLVRGLFDNVRTQGANSGGAGSDLRRLRRKDGSIVPVEVYRRYLKSGDKDIVVSVARDVSERLKAQEDLVRFRTALETSPDLIFLIDLRTLRYIDANETACRMLGYQREELLGMSLLQINANVSEEDLRGKFQETVALGPDRVVTEAEGRMARRKDGSLFPIEIARRYLRIGERDIIVSVSRDITERKRAEEALQLRNLAIEASVNAILITNHLLPDQPIEYVNPAFERMTGYSSAEIAGRNCRFLQGADRNQPEIELLRTAIREGCEARVVLRNYRRNGDAFWAELSISPLRDANGRITHYVGVLSDITEARNVREQLEHQASHDALTGLPNRSLLFDRLNQAIAQAHRYQRTIAVAFVDLDNFKFINDSLGHGAGDQVLRISADRLRACLREGDTVARHGGDEFVLLLNDQSGRESVTQVVSRIVEKLAAPLAAEGQELATTCSVGISLYPEHGTDAATLLKNADAAMYRAKARGKNSFRFYTVDLGTHLGDRLKLETQLRRALELGEFVLHYQPKIDLRSRAIYGLEALIRWRHPQDGLVSPDRFIGIAEETGLIVPIGEWALLTGCAQVRAWSDAGLPPMMLSVNISARQFRRGDLVETVSRALAETGLAAQRLELELTESLVMENAEEFIDTLNALKRLGVSLSVDDFGTGYSSLSYLKRFPVDRLKIDQSFVRDIGTDPNDAAIARAVIQLGHSLDLRVTAEGVETAEQLRFLREHGCDEVQGFLFSRPLAAERVVELLREGLDPATMNGA
ncbi:MAG: PAS domain S-box protein [Betaproteobacteria bacterium]|nr:PAS domain S-box protein [Betaproteobacteria bacterium]